MPIINPAVGSITFITMDGIPPSRGEEMKDITRPGVNGIGMKKDGTRGRRYTLRCLRDEASAATAKTTVDNALAQKSTLVTVRDALNESRTIQLVHDVRPIMHKKGVTAIGGLASGPVMLELEYELQDGGP